MSLLMYIGNKERRATGVIMRMRNYNFDDTNQYVKEMRQLELPFTDSIPDKKRRATRERYLQTMKKISKDKPVLMWAELNTAGNVMAICRYRHWFTDVPMNKLVRVSVKFDHTKMHVTVMPHIYERTLDLSNIGVRT